MTGWSSRSTSATLRATPRCAAVDVPIVLDQSVFTDADVLAVIRHDAADAVVIGFHETGGLLNLRKAAIVADVGVARQSPRGHRRVRDLHLGRDPVLATIPNLTDGHQVMHELFVEDVLVDGTVVIENGRSRVSEQPGLGIDIDWDRVERLSASTSASVSTRCDDRVRLRSVAACCARCARRRHRPDPDRFGARTCSISPAGHCSSTAAPPPQKLVRAGFRPTGVERLFFTHHHFDHNADYATFALSRWDRGADLIPDLRVHGPWPTREVTDRLFGREGALRSTSRPA